MNQDEQQRTRTPFRIARGAEGPEPMTRRHWGKSALALTGIGLLQKANADQTEIIIKTDDNGISEVLVRETDGPPASFSSRPRRPSPLPLAQSCDPNLGKAYKVQVKVTEKTQGDFRYELVPHDGIQTRKSLTLQRIEMSLHPDSKPDSIWVRQRKDLTGGDLDLLQFFKRSDVITPDSPNPRDGKFELTKQKPTKVFTFVTKTTTLKKQPGPNVRCPFALKNGQLDTDYGRELLFEYRLSKDDNDPVLRHPEPQDHTEYHMEC